MTAEAEILQQAAQFQERAREVNELVQQIEQLQQATIGLASGNQLRFQQVTTGHDVWPEALLSQVFFTGKAALLREKRERLAELLGPAEPPAPAVAEKPEMPGEINLGGLLVRVKVRSPGERDVVVIDTSWERCLTGEECARLIVWLEQYLAWVRVRG